MMHKNVYENAHRAFFITAKKAFNYPSTKNKLIKKENFNLPQVRSK